MRTHLLRRLLPALLLAAPATAHAQIRDGFLSNIITFPSSGLQPQVSAPLDLGFSANVRGSFFPPDFPDWEQVVVCRYGFVSFGPLVNACAPPPAPGFTFELFDAGAVLAPMHARLSTFDTQQSIGWGTGTILGRSAFGVTWDNVLDLSTSASTRLSMQLVLIDRSDRAPGDFDAEFNYGELADFLLSDDYFSGAVDDGSWSGEAYTYATTRASNGRTLMCWVGGSVDNSACDPSGGGPHAVPEPASVLLMAAGLLLLIVHRRRRPSVRVIAALAAAGALGACAPDQAPMQSPDIPGEPNRLASIDGSPAPDTDGQEGWLVLFEDGVAPAERNRILGLAAVGADLDYILPGVNGAVLRDANVDVLRTVPGVQGVYPNSRFAQTYQTSALYWRRGWQWNMRQIQAHQAATTGNGVKVCIIDGPVTALHQELAGKVIAAAAFRGSGTWGINTDNGSSHGVHVASTVTTNGIGIASVAPNARLLSANVFGPSLTTTLAQVISAMHWCTENNVDVINMSLGGPRTRNVDPWSSDFLLYSLFTTIARSRGIVVVAAAGNENTAIPSLGTKQAFLPAEATGVITVGATAPAVERPFPFAPQPPHASFDTRAAYSNYNSGLSALGPGVRIYAPGGARSTRAQLGVMGACNPGASASCLGGSAYLSYFGTSMASPHVAGVVALITERYATAPRTLARTQAVEACLFQTSDALPSGPPFFGRRRVNARRATTELCPQVAP